MITQVKDCIALTTGHAHYGYVSHLTVASLPITLVSQSRRGTTAFYLNP